MAESIEQKIPNENPDDPPKANKATKGNMGKPKKSRGKNGGKLKFKNWKLIDSILFVVIILMITAMMMFAGFAEKDGSAEMDFQRTDEYSALLLRVFVTGTHAGVNYTDYDNAETSYQEWSSRRLIIEDIRLRENLGPYKAPANTASLEDGIENALRITMDALTGDERTFSLNVSWQSVDGSDRDRFFKINGRDFNKVNDASKFISSSNLDISVIDPGQTELGDTKIELTLTIYDI